MINLQVGEIELQKDSSESTEKKNTPATEEREEYFDTLSLQQKEFELVLKMEEKSMKTPLLSANIVNGIH